ncbi:putative chromatin remodeler Bromodomain family [Helianthus annuus]|nr:putative chromatin remodeler Bromodomain family [Helianthus annuus]
MGKATAAKKKKGRPSLLDLHKRALEQNQQQLHRKSTRRNPNSTSAGEDDYYDDDDDERKQKKVKLVVRLPQSDQQPHLSSSLIRSSSGSDSNADVDNRKLQSGSDVVADHQGEKVLKAMDTLHGSPLQAGPTTPLPDQKLLVFILDRLQKKDTHAVFSEPVDPDELPDYFEIIKQPMDFGTVRSKLDGGLYSNLEELEADVYLICTNAMQYNSSDTVYFRQARSIHELAKRDFENLRQEGEDGELKPKVVRRGRPPGKLVKKTPGRPPLDRVGPESTSGATLATTEDNANESTPYNLRKAPPVLYRFQADGLLGSHRSRNGEHYSEFLSDWNEEFPERIRRADMKYGNKNLIIDETRRDTYKQFHPSTYAYDSSLLSNFGGERKQLLAVGLHAEHGYARSLARFAANLGSVVWKIASKKIEKALPPGTKFAPGSVGEIDPSPPSSFFPPGNPRPVSCLVPDCNPNRPESQTQSTSGPNAKVEIIEPDSGTKTGSPLHHVRNGFNSAFGSTSGTGVEHERICEGGGQPVKPTSWQQVSSPNPSLVTAPLDQNIGSQRVLN